MPIALAKIRAIDVHVHAEVSCHDPEDPVMGQYFDAASAYFKAPRERPKMPEIIELYRESGIALVLFTVDCESALGAKRVSNYEVAEQALKNDDICLAFASIDPHKGKLGAREARDLIENYGVRGFKFHGIAQDAHPADRMAYPIYEVIAEHGLPAIFHTGHSGMGTGMPGGGGMRLKYGQPILIDDVAVDFPAMKIILAHPSWPWVDESLSMALHKDNVFIDLSGWSPKYFPAQVIRYANTQLRHKMMFGSDFPLIHPDKWIAAAQEVGFREEVMPLILKDNAARVLGARGMKPRIGLITLGVADLARSLAFYRDGLGLPTENYDPEQGVVFFRLEGTWLALFPREELAADGRLDPAGSGFAGVTLAHNELDRAGVDAVFAEALAAGATALKVPEEAFWGGYSGYFADPDGHVWEVAHNPFMDLT